MEPALIIRTRCDETMAMYNMIPARAPQAPLQRLRCEHACHNWLATQRTGARTHSFCANLE